MNHLLVLAAKGGSGGGNMMTIIILYVVIIGIFWFFAIRPQKKQQKEHESLVSTLEVGDSILTSSGFFGVVIDIMDEVVIVEFGSNKNCRIPMTIEDLQEGNPDTVITRAHFARHLIRLGVVKDTKEAFSQYLGEDSPFYVSRNLISATDAIALIIKAGGVPVLAHPIHYHMEESRLRSMVAEFKKHGLAGIEVKYSNHTAQDEAFAARMAKEFDLLPSGGSDFHGSNKPDIDLGTGRGNLAIPYDYLLEIKKRASA